MFLGAGSGGTRHAAADAVRRRTTPSTTQASTASTGGSSRAPTTTKKHKQAQPRRTRSPSPPRPATRYVSAHLGIGHRPGGEDEPPHRPRPSYLLQQGSEAVHPGQGPALRHAGGARQRRPSRVDGQPADAARTASVQLQDHQPGHRHGVTRSARRDPADRQRAAARCHLRPQRGVPGRAARGAGLLDAADADGGRPAGRHRGGAARAGRRGTTWSSRSGGLGPTHDDRTVEALAAVAGVPLELDEAVLARITGLDRRGGRAHGLRPAPASTPGNRKQARIPRGASVLGMAGTAPGLVIELDGARGGGAAGRAVRAAAAVATPRPSTRCWRR